MQKQLTQENIELLRDQTIAHVVEMQNKLQDLIRRKAKNDDAVSQNIIDDNVKALIDAEKASNVAWNIPDVPRSK